MISEVNKVSRLLVKMMRSSTSSMNYPRTQLMESSVVTDISSCTTGIRESRSWVPSMEVITSTLCTFTSICWPGKLSGPRSKGLFLFAKKSSTKQKTASMLLGRILSRLVPLSPGPSTTRKSKPMPGSTKYFQINMGPLWKSSIAKWSPTVYC